MAQVFNIYCDESCHLEHDEHSVMTLGALMCPLEEVVKTGVRIREIVQKHNLHKGFEIKSVKVSPAKQQLYLDLLDFFFDDDHLTFRALIVADKRKLKHEKFGQDHDTWYYKMYFELLRVMLRPGNSYRIYLDSKDSSSWTKAQTLMDVLRNNTNIEFRKEIVERVQPVQSSQVVHVQMTDLLTAIVGYANRGVTTSPAKLKLIERMRQRSGYQLTRTTLLAERKVNLFKWDAKEVQ